MTRYHPSVVSMTRNVVPIAATPMGVWRLSALLKTGVAVVMTTAIIGGGCANAGCANAPPANAKANTVCRTLISTLTLNRPEL